MLSKKHNPISFVRATAKSVAENSTLGGRELSQEAFAFMRNRSTHALFSSSVSVATLSALSAFGFLSGPALAQSPSPVPAPSPSDAKASAEAQAPATPAAPAPLTITGAVELNYTHNFNQPFTGENTFLYNTNAGQFAVNLADLRIGRAATETSRVGFFIRLVEGEVARRNFNLGDNNRLLEGYGTFLVPLSASRNLKVDAGQFVTHVGYETIEVGTNNFFSRNFLFQFPSPFYNAGVRASYPVSAKLTVNGYIYNRYNGVYDPRNTDLAPGFQLVYAASPTTSLVLNGLTSRENLAYDGTAATPLDNRQQSVIDLVATSQVSPRLKVVFEGLY
ncbi:MAG: outer membrane beta-barrel protein, partial [Cytophagales bacterium]|nr:outer membrane beta-barrel protein [Armatimonadota bacterium]